MVASAFSQGGYRCEGYCGGIDVAKNTFYDRGYLFSEYPSHPELGYRALLKKCQKQMPIGIQAKIYRNIEVTRDERTITESWRIYGSGFEVLDGYRWIEIIKYENQSSYYYKDHQVKTRIKVDSLTSKESCQYDETIIVPSYDGDLPAQG